MESIFRKLKCFFNLRWRLAVLDPLKGRWLIEPNIKNISYLKSQNAAGRHILMQPIEAQHFLLLDDISRDILCRHHQHPDKTWKPGRMVIETSPANFQVWIRSARPLTLKEKRSLITILKSDPSADPNNRFGRCPGFRNQKPCHRAPGGSYPLSRLIWVDWLSSALIPQWLFHTYAQSAPFSHPPRVGGVCPLRSRYLRKGESQTDFAYALALVRRGYPDHLIRSLILDQRTSWVNHKGEKRLSAYLARTISRARAIIEAP